MFRVIYNTGLQLSHGIYEAGAHAYQTITQWKNQTVEAITTTWTHTIEGARNHRITHFAASAAGRQILAAQAENIVEATSYFGTVYALQPMSAQIGKAIGTTIVQKTSTMVSPLLLFCKGLHTVSTTRWFLTARFMHRSLESTILLILIYSSMLGIRFGSEGIAERAKEYEKDVGEIFITYGAGILASFLTLKFTNTTDEVFWDTENITQTYPFKTIQSMLLCDALNSSGYMPSNTTVKALTNLLLGSIFYNLIDLTQFLIRFRQGALLNHNLPNQLRLSLRQINSGHIRPIINTVVPQVLIHREKILEPNFLFEKGKQQGYQKLKDWAAQAYPEWEELITEGSKQASLFTDLISQLKKHSQRNASNPLVEGFKKYLEVHIIEQKSLEKLEEYQIAKKIAESSITQKANLFIGNLSSNCLIRSANLYFHLLTEVPHIIQAMDQIHLDFTNRPLEEMRGPVLDLLAQDEQILESLQTYLNLPSRNSVRKRLEFIKQLICPAQGYIDMSVDSITHFLEVFEDRMIGMTVASQDQRHLQAQILTNHIERIFFLAPLTISSIREPVKKKEMQRFYVYSSRVIAEYYTPVLGKSTALSIQSLIEGQLRQTQLYKIEDS